MGQESPGAVLLGLGIENAFWDVQVLHQTDHNKPAWDELAWAVRTGGKAFEKTHDGLSEFEWLKLDPKEEDKFSKAMKQVDNMGTLDPAKFPFRQSLLPAKLSLMCQKELGDSLTGPRI